MANPTPATTISTEVVSPISTRLNVTVPTARVDVDFEKRLVRFAKTVKINGFRPGKVPLAKVRADYGMGLRQEVINDVLRDTLFEAIDDQKIRAVGMPNVEKVDLTDAGLVYSALVETYPEITLNPLSGLSMVKQNATVTDADVDKMIEQLRTQRQTFSEKTGASADKDQVTIDFEGSIDGEKFEGGSSENFKLTLGSGQMIPGFETGIVGMKAGEEKVIDVTFPEDYQAENLKGKAAQFKITVKAVEVATLPEVDGDFIAQFGGKKEDSVDKFKADVRKNMERELTANLNNVNKTAAFDALLAGNEIEVPQSMVDEEITRQRKQLLQQFAAQFGNNANFKEDMLPNTLFQEKSERSVKLGVLLAQVIEEGKLTVDQDKVTAFIADMAQSYEDSEEVIQYFSTDKQQRGQIEAVVLENQIADHIFAGAKVTAEATTYEAVKQAQAANRE